MTAGGRRVGPLEVLFVGLPRDLRRKRLILSLQAYLDESATDRVFVFSGFVAPIDAWEGFADKWLALLAAEPSVPAPFHFRKHSRVYHFGGDEAKRNRKLSDLLNLARKETLLSISIVVSRAEYEEALRWFPIDMGKFDLWLFAYAHIMPLIEHAMRNTEWAGSKVSLILDKKDKWAGLIMDSWDTYKSQSDGAVRAILGGGPQFPSDEDVAALQAADLLAGSVRRRWHLRLGGAVEEPNPWDGQLSSESTEADNQRRSVEICIGKAGIVDWLLRVMQRQGLGAIWGFHEYLLIANDWKKIGSGGRSHGTEGQTR